MDELVQAMKKSLADTFAFYLKAQGFHWNVEGPNFPQYHALFDTIYNEVYGSIDQFAEEIRSLDAYAQGVTEAKKPSPKLTPVEMKKTDTVSEEINNEAYERLQKVFAFKNYES